MMEIKTSNFIIGGTIKAGTSSIFTYLSAHPEICSSSVKETFFFTQEYTADVKKDIVRYLKYFPAASGEILMEASPNYLAYKEDVASRIYNLLPEAKLLFILRNPVDRLYSYYNFSMAKLQLPADMSFTRYIQLCKKYSAGDITATKAGLAEKHLRALDIGVYHRYIQNYLDCFPGQQIKIMFFDDLQSNQRVFMQEVAGFIGIDTNFYEDYTFHKSNVTFSGRNKFIHRIALMVNYFFETIFRRYPGIKQQLVRRYKSANQRREGYTAMDESVRSSLTDYYAADNAKLKTLLAEYELPEWLDAKKG